MTSNTQSSAQDADSGKDKDTSPRSEAAPDEVGLAERPRKRADPYGLLGNFRDRVITPVKNSKPKVLYTTPVVNTTPKKRRRRAHALSLASAPDTTPVEGDAGTEPAGGPASNPPNYGRPWSTGEDEVRLELQKMGLTTHEMAEELGRSYHSVSSRASQTKSGKLASGVGWTKERTDQLLDLRRNQGKDWTELEQYFPEFTIGAIKARFYHTHKKGKGSVAGETLTDTNVPEPSGVQRSRMSSDIPTPKAADLANLTPPSRRSKKVDTFKYPSYESPGASINKASADLANLGSQNDAALPASTSLTVRPLGNMSGLSLDTRGSARSFTQPLSPQKRSMPSDESKPRGKDTDPKRRRN